MLNFYTIIELPKPVRIKIGKAGFMPEGETLLYRGHIDNGTYNALKIYITTSETYNSNNELINTYERNNWSDAIGIINGPITIDDNTRIRFRLTVDGNDAYITTESL